MAKFNEKKVHSLGKYATVTMTIYALLQALINGKVMIPREQRKMENKGAEYKKKSESFVAHLLIHAFLEGVVDDKMRKTLRSTFGDDIVVVQGVPQFIGISIDEDGYIYLSDGQHRFLHYIMDFIRGDMVLRYDTDFGNDFINDAMKILFNAVELDIGEGKTNSDKYISKNMLAPSHMEKILNTQVIAAVVEAVDEDERAALFIAMNSCTPIKQVDLDNAAFGRYNMWQCIESIMNALEAVDCDKNECVTFEFKKKYNAEDTKILKTLFYAKMRTLVPIVAHAGLLTYLSDKQRREYQWKYSTQSQAEQVRVFFKATEKMSRKACDKLLIKMMNDVIKIGRKIYGGDIDTMKHVKSMKSLLVGQMHAMNTCDLDESEFFEIAFNISNELVYNYVYTPGDGSKECPAAYFNNGHHSRTKNEKFYNLVMAAANMGGNE